LVSPFWKLAIHGIRSGKHRMNKSTIIARYGIVNFKMGRKLQHRKRNAKIGGNNSRPAIFVFENTRDNAIIKGMTNRLRS
jgi:hypothetical protein